MYAHPDAVPRPENGIYSCGFCTNELETLIDNSSFFCNKCNMVVSLGQTCEFKNQAKATDKCFFHLICELDKHWVKKNGRDIGRNFKTGRLFPIKSPGLEQAEVYLINAMQLAKNKNQSFNFPFTKPVHMKSIFTFPRKEFFCQTKGTSGEPVGRRNSKIPDLSNLYQLPEDCLQTAGVIENDSLIDSHDGSRRLPGLTFRLEIKLYPMS